MNQDISYDIAIIGMACRVPDAENLGEFWENLMQGKESIQFFSDEQMIREGEPESTITQSNYVNAGGVLDDIDRFDSAFFDMPKAEADITDPQHRLFMECVWSALEDSGNIPGAYQGITGVFGSSSTNTYLYRNLLTNRSLMDSVGIHPLLIGNEKDFLCTKVSYKLGLMGPSMTVQTACSSSLVAVHMAVQSLLNGECEMAAAGGVTVRSSQRAGYEYTEGGILSPDGVCRAFDNEAKGTVTGNGAGVVILKRYDDAVRDGDLVYAKIKASAVKNDGLHKVGYTAPGVEGQIQTIRDALDLSGVHPEDISYIEAHGTGTQLGDPVELSALSQVFEEKTNRKGYCAVGSVKSSIGHLDVAAGIVGLIKVSLMLYHKKLVPTVNFLTPNLRLNLEKSPFYISTDCEDWESDGPRLAGVSSFGLGGTNCHIVLEEHAGEEVEGEHSPLYLVPLSARTEISLSGYMEKLLARIETSEVQLEDIAYTLATGRKEFDHRSAIVCGNLDELRHKLSAVPAMGKVPARPLPLTILVSDLKVETLAELLPFVSSCTGSFKKSIGICADVLGEHGLTFSSLLGCSSDHIERRDLGMSTRAAARTASFIFSYALVYGMVTDFGLRPNAYSYEGDGLFVIKAIMGQTGIPEVIEALLQDSPPSPAEDTAANPAAALYDHESKQGHLLHVGNLELNKDAATHVYQVIGTYGEAADHPLLYSILETIGELWCSGLNVDWKAAFQSLAVRKIPLPTYSFDRTRHWIEAEHQNAEVIAAEQVAAWRSEEEVVRKVKDIWLQHLAVDSVNADSDFFLAGGDSFQAIQIQSLMNQEFGVKLSLAKFIAEPTFGAQVKLLLSELRKSPASTEELDERVVRLHKGDDRKSPIFLIHPAGGTVMVYKALIQYLECDRNIFGIQSKDVFLERIADQAETIEETAAEYLKLIKRLYPKGPYTVGGHSYGGNVAFEIGLQLQKRGDSVEDILLFDSHPPSAYFNNRVMSDQQFYEAFPLISSMYFSSDMNQDVAASVEVMAKPRESLEDIVAYLKATSSQLSSLADEEIKHFFSVWVSNHNALRTHNPQDVFDGRLHFFQAKQPQPKEILETLNITLEEGMDLTEWGKLTSDFRSYPIPGTHYSMLNEPNVMHIANVLKGIL